MSVTGIRALLEAAEFLNKEENAKKKERSEVLQNSILEKPEESLIMISRTEKHAKKSLSHSSSTSSIERIASSQDREAHNRLEKGRRADLKARFECIQHLLPATKGRKCSNLTILRNATRHIQAQARLSREYVTEIQHFSQEKSQKDKKLERAWQRLSVLGVDLARVRRKVRSKLAQREKREECSVRGMDSEELEREDQPHLAKRDKKGLLRRHRSASPSCLPPRLSDGGASSLSEDEDGASESTTTASECGSNVAERGELTDEASECGEVVVQEGTVPSQSHTCVTLSPTPLSPASQDTRPLACTAPASSLHPSFSNSCSSSITFASSFSGLTAQASEPLSGTSSDSGISSGANDDASGEVKLPMKKRKLARSLVQDLSPSQAAAEEVHASNEAAGASSDPLSSSQPAEKKRMMSPQLTSCLLKTATVKPRHEVGEKQISLITTLPSSESVPSLALSTSSATPSLSASMPLLQRTLTGPRPTTLVRHASFDSPESLDPNWMNQRIVPVYQLLSGANASSAPGPSPSLSSSSSSSSLSASAPQAALMPTLHSSLKSTAGSSLTVPSGGAPAEKLSLVTHSPLNVLKPANPAPVSLSGPTVVAQAPAFALSGPPATKTVVTNSAGPAQLVLPMLGAGDSLILRNLTGTAGRHQPIVLMPLTASAPGAAASPSLVPIQLVSDNVLSAAALVNGSLDHS